MTIRAGERRHWIEIQAPVKTRDEYGQLVAGDPSTVAEVWASIEPLAGVELTNARAMHAETTHTVTVPWFEGLTSRYQVLFGTRVFQILAAINQDEASVEWRLLCKERN